MIKIDLNKTYGKRSSSISFQFKVDLEEKKIIGIYGKSGVGKSTLLRMIAGLEEPTNGVLQVGEELWYNSGEKIDVKIQNRSIGFLFQDYALFPNMTVKQNILFGANAEPDQQLIDRIISIAELESILGKYPTELSGGQQQRVALARALARKPKVLLLDEPLSALDEDLREVLQDEILSIHKEFDLTIIFISHSRTETLKLANDLVVLENGKVTYHGAPDVWFNKKPKKGVLLEQTPHKIKVQVNGELIEVDVNPHK